MAAEADQPLAALIRTIDERRATTNLSSAVRVAVLEWYQGKVE
jgi:predicted DNA-binding ribbon-helix-helix protein